MFIKMVFGAIWRQKRKFGLVMLTIILGTSLAQAMLMMMLDVGDKINQELKTYGANINVLPKDASLLSDLYGISIDEKGGKKYLAESDIPKLKTIFWAYNIENFAPHLEEKVELSANNQSQENVVVNGTWFKNNLALPTGDSVTTGLINLKSWWTIDGEWANDAIFNQAVIGTKLAQKLGLSVNQTVQVLVNNQTMSYQITGIAKTGDESENQLFVGLSSLQKLTNLVGKVESIEVSAITTPDNELARRAAVNPDLLSVKDWETWYCTAYVSSISYQIEEVIGNSKAKVLRQVAESEGEILNKTQLLMVLITVLSLLSSVLGITSIVTTSMIERSQEIGLIKALGASNGSIIRRFLTEILIVGLLGGGIGMSFGYLLAQIIGNQVFGVSIALKTEVIPIVIILILAVTVLGSLQAIRMLLTLKPAEVLHGR
ncbi:MULTISPECIES: ABC transporter permease [unclassified Enterococcus]|uniref:ABC transporter permease n=1 Tax=unclassified Enterococcus TaxID=2608891 RepID=UPI001552A2A0|nr:MULTISPECIES: ABC transporter permease [unclassified Enterococcus]MBS7576721.1 ABC transporter permease [Enterococcus sp. MMGLQ5-2]MBS7583792.1 ABC transporter permease [Enterococcus sp. MMGLQ5-1]NPD11653.1 ABC transporter permease [Enterococcus sp. MMGLQ5-1]NPD36558.1 ABC transporter permease [Enterococcus sp. MMGLQ5-2]